MNFLMRQSQTTATASSGVGSEHPTPVTPPAIKAVTGRNSDVDDNMSSSCFGEYDDTYVDVKDDEGWIIIPSKEIPDDWSDAPDMQWFRSLGRSFVFPGEQVHIVACLSAAKQDTEIITPFKVAAVMNKSGAVQGAKNQNGTVASPCETQQAGHDGHVDAKRGSDCQVDVSASESFLRMENHRRQTETLLESFKGSHFFIRIAESGEQLWSKRSTTDSSETVGETDSMDENTIELETSSTMSAAIDRGRFDARISGGVSRNSIKCCSLANGDIVVLLQVNVGVDSLNDPILEILQFKELKNGITALETDLSPNAKHSPCNELLKWVLPLDNSQRSSNRSPPLVNASHLSSFSASNGSQLFSFSNFRSYSMSSLPQNTVPVASQPVSVASTRPNFDLEDDWDHFALPRFGKTPKTGSQDLLSFRGVPLEPDRFSVCCGLEGIYIPGRRWRKRLEIIQPVDIQTFAANCNTNDLLCVQIKNVSPAHIPDMVIYIDAITIVLEEASKGPPSAVPIACIEAGTDHCLPNLALRRGEEHSFILKPAISVLKRSTTHVGKNTKSPRPKGGSRAASMQLPLKDIEGDRNLSSSDKYTVIVSCRCNYSESRLFFKKPTDWRPRISRDIMISVASEITKETINLTRRVSQLPVKVLTLQASNLTSEDLSLTILAPASFTSPPSVVSLNLTPSTPNSPSAELTSTQNTGPSLPFAEQAVSIADVIPPTALSCTHLWLQSRVPLGLVPSQSSVTVKLELLPLTDGIITLDTLQIYVQEKGVTYIPEHALRINTTSSVATGII